MNGIIITIIIVLLVAVIGLGFGVLTLSEKVEQMDVRFGDYTSYQLYERFVDEVLKHEAERDKWMSEVSITTNKLSAGFASVKRATMGTADETEFCRMKTAVTQTLPDRIKRLEDVIGIHDETEITYNGLVPHQEEK